MKLRAPRCREALLVTSSAACQLIQSAPAPAPSSAAAAAPLARTQASSSARLMGLMKNHSLGHRFHLVDARVPRHQEEEQEITDGKDARENYVDPFGRLQAQIAERNE